MTEEANARIFVMGYGNPGRLDDGLGPAFAERIQALAIPGVTVDSDYQLSVEDVATIIKHDIILFADASVDGREPFDLQPLAAQHGGLGFSSHTLSAGALLGLAKDLFGASPQAYLLAIRGYDYDEFGERLSEHAQTNLDATVASLEPLLRNRFAAAGA
ncbi:MAG: hydrogenase maturation protease [bacterium]